jgi:HK97 family phage prohead protease
MSELLIVTRELPPDMLERSGDGWTVAGIVVPFERVTEVSDDGVNRYREVFDRGSFDRDIAKGGRWVNLMIGHAGDDGDRFLGRCNALQARPEGLWGEFRLDRNHPRADEARNGELRSWSVAAAVYRKRTDPPDVRRYLQCGLRHVAATPHPQYADAGVMAVREEVTIDETPQTPRLDAARERLTALKSLSRAATPAS